MCVLSAITIWTNKRYSFTSFFKQSDWGSSEAFWIGFALFLLNSFRFIAKPCAINLGIQDSGPHRAQPNAILEKVFTSITKSPDGKRLEGLSKQLDWDVRKIQRWFRHRRNQDKPTTLTKFCESMWRFTFYLSIFFYGIRFLWTVSWSVIPSPPCSPLTSRLYYYYILELAFYWSLMFSQFTDIKRKDFLIMFVHHLATIGLITFSYMNNMVRVGTLVLCLHDASDFLLEAAKLANYAKYQRLCDAFFMLFGVVFIVTRLGIYPFWILNTTLFESWELIGPYPSWWLFNGLLITLQMLHIIWSYLIIRTAYKALMRGKVRFCQRKDCKLCLLHSFLLFSVPDWSWTVSSFACKCDLCFCLFTETHLCLFQG
uniref:Ceramide synthase 5 n=1 Tax=Buteo japonicus TaxID=224669 RepID=A0A8C0B1M4_9AVES